VKALQKRFDSFQQRHKALAIPLAVVKKFGDDQGGNLAALLSYYAFFSLFPLLLVFVTIMGFVLHGDPSAQKSVSTSVLGHFPVIGDQIRGKNLTGSVAGLVIGIVTSVLAGTGITAAASNAFDHVWAVPLKERPGFLASKLRGLTLLGALGGLFIITSGATGLLAGNLGPAAKVGGIVLALALNCTLFLASFKLLGTEDVPLRALMPGAVVAAILWEVLQVIATVYIDHIKHSSGAYGIFALTIGVLVWLHLGAQMTVYTAEINVVLERKLWPRQFFGEPATPADEQTLTALAKVEERHDGEQIEVTFESPPAEPPVAPA
jgi:YihY family inner membrane protein